MKLNSAEYIHTLVEALKLAYADRDTYLRRPAFNKIPAERLLSKEYGAERRQADRRTTLRSNSAPATWSRIRPSIRCYSDIARHKIDDALLAKDTTCVDAIDKDGVVISITPSGALDAHFIAGDTGIPLTQRAQSFLLVPGHPNELAGGKRPRVTLSPTLVVSPGRAPDGAFHPRRRQPGPGAAAGAASTPSCSA